MRLVNLDITVALQKAEIPHKIEVPRTELETREANHFGEIAPAVAPVERDDRDAVPGSGGVALTTVRGQLVEWNRAHAFAFDHHGSGFGKLRIGGSRRRNS